MTGPVLQASTRSHWTSASTRHRIGLQPVFSRGDRGRAECPIDGRTVAYKGTGRPPQFCSDACARRGRELRANLAQLRLNLVTWQRMRRVLPGATRTVRRLEADIALGERLVALHAKESPR